MNKARLVFLMALLSTILVGCGSKNVSEYAEVYFEGYNSYGTAKAYIDEEQLIKSLYNFDEEIDFVDKETQMEIMTLLDSVKVKVENNEGLSNGDKVKVIVNVDQDKTKKIKGGTKEVEVNGLEEPDVLTTADTEKHLVPVFSGSSGRGKLKFENTFPDRLNNVNFEIKNNGKLSNGDEAELVINDDLKEQLLRYGYILEDSFNPTFKVKGLNVVANKAEEIANLEDIKRLINEEIQKEYRKTYSYTYNVQLEKYMYRQFENNEKEVSRRESTGNFIALFTVSQYSGDQLNKTFVVARGFSDIYLDADNKANIADLMKNRINERMDQSYSLETVTQMYEGYGYEVVK